MERWIPQSWPQVVPRLFVDQPAECVRFLKSVFDASADVFEDRPSVVHIGTSKIMVSAAGPREATRACLYVYVPDVDAAYERAISLGASTIESPGDTPYGDRRAMVKDPWNNDWQIASFGG